MCVYAYIIFLIVCCLRALSKSNCFDRVTFLQHVIVNANYIDAYVSMMQINQFQFQFFTPTLSSLCDKADLALFDNIITSSTHPLHTLLPPKVEKLLYPSPAATDINFHVKLLHLTKAISFIVYYIVTFYRLRSLIDISIF